MVQGTTCKSLLYVIYSEGITVLMVAEGARCDRKTLSGSGSPKNKVFQTAYFSDWKVEFLVMFALILCLAPTESVA